MAMVLDTKKSNFGSQTRVRECLRFRIWFIMALNKMRQICDRCGKGLLQNASFILLQDLQVLLQNAKVITKCDIYQKLCRYSH